MSRDEAGNCIGCGLAVSLHYDPSNRMRGCAFAATQLRPVDRGKLFGLKLKKNHEARQAALKSIRPVPSGQHEAQFIARVGGAVRGVTIRVASRSLAEQYVHAYYNEQMLAFVENRKPGY